MAGKGDKPRPVNLRTYWNNYDEIFRKKQPKEENARLETNTIRPSIHGSSVPVADLHNPKLG
jgi:hypothetical protein